MISKLSLRIVARFVMVWAGTSTLTTYLMPYVFYAMSSLTGVVLPDCLTHGAMGIVNCLTFALVVIAVTGVLERINIKLKL